MNKGSLQAQAPSVPTEREADHVDELIRRLACGERSNELDVLIEVALFEPDKHYTAARANAAGTKVIYTQRDGPTTTCWARDWSLVYPEQAAALLRDRLAAQASNTAGGYAAEGEVNQSPTPSEETPSTSETEERG